MNPKEIESPLALDKRVELSHAEIETIVRERGGALVSAKQMRSLTALGLYVEESGAIRIANGEAYFGRTILRDFMIRLHEKLQDASLDQLIAAAPAVAVIHKQFTESIKATKEIAEIQSMGNRPRFMGPSTTVLSFPTGPIKADTVVINTETTAKPSPKSQ